MLRQSCVFLCVLSTTVEKLSNLEVWGDFALSFSLPPFICFFCCAAADALWFAAMPIRRLRGFRSRLFGLGKQLMAVENPLKDLMLRNQRWARRMTKEDPNFFTSLVGIQKPKYLWIGCSDSRVPANQVVDLPPGAVFVHRNIANVVAHSDFNCLSVMEYAVKILKVSKQEYRGCGGTSSLSEL